MSKNTDKLTEIDFVVIILGVRALIGVRMVDSEQEENSHTQLAGLRLSEERIDNAITQWIDGQLRNA